MNLPEDYIHYLSNIGWGETKNGRMIYSGPISPNEIYNENFKNKNNIVLLGDDFQGNCLGYDLTNKVYGEVSDFGEWEVWEKNELLSSYV